MSTASHRSWYTPIPTETSCTASGPCRSSAASSSRRRAATTRSPATRGASRTADSVDFSGVERALDELDDLFLGRRLLLLSGLRFSFCALGEDQGESPAGDVVEGG